MKPELESLLLTNEEVKNCAGISLKKIENLKEKIQNFSEKNSFQSLFISNLTTHFKTYSQLLGPQELLRLALFAIIPFLFLILCLFEEREIKEIRWQIFIFHVLQGLVYLFFISFFKLKGIVIAGIFCLLLCLTGEPIVKTFIKLTKKLKKLSKHKKQLEKCQNFTSLIEDIYKHNQIVANLDVLEKLQSAGNSVSIIDRDRVIKALTITKQDLILALKTEKILRENPQFKPQYFYENLTALKALQMSEKVSEYGRLINDALQVGVSVQEKMKNWE